MRPYTFEFEDGAVRAWSLTESGATPRLVEDYAPSVYVAGPDDALTDLRARLESDPKVVATAFERWATDLHEAHVGERSRLLRIDCERVGEVRMLAREIRGVHERGTHAPGTFRLFDVDLEPGFRYCLDRGIDPTPSRALRTLELSLEEAALAGRDVAALELEGERVLEGDAEDEREREDEDESGSWSAESGGTEGKRDERDERAVLETLRDRLEREDPDVLVVSHGDLIPLLEERASELGLGDDEFHLGRLPGWTRLAGESTYESYGQVGHSPARYRVPGRAIIDTSNSFLWNQSGLAGLEYMVEATGRPLQETAWGSIGTLLTSRQIRLARRERAVLAPWNKWEPERFADVSTLHAADRGGFTFAPEVGLHEEVHEIDFASLYPRLICEHGISPETVDCAHDAGAVVEGHRVPELGYEICEGDPFLSTVLEPLLEDRAAIKDRLADDPPEPEASRLRAESGAIKWVLVSCFGYQGYRNAKYGRIECHEAINAYAREIALTAKRRLEDAGWRIVHGIVDSLWVTPREGLDTGPKPIAEVVADVSREVGIPLEHDGSYEWVCFVPLRDSVSTAGASGSDSASLESGDTGTRSGSMGAGALASAPAGALTKYFGKGDSGTYTIRGIETRQRSTPPFVAESQRAFIEALDRERDPEAVCDVLERRLARLRSGAVDPAALEITRQVSKPLSAYRRRTRAVAALERYERHGMDRRPGQSVRYVVADDDARGPERVRLPFELDPGDEFEYDADHYATSLVRACESVVSPLGWDRSRIRRHLRDGRPVRLSTFTD